MLCLSDSIPERLVRAPRNHAPAQRAFLRVGQEEDEQRVCNGVQPQEVRVEEARTQAPYRRTGMIVFVDFYFNRARKATAK